uniref:Xylulose kinase-1 n=1 Tax=Tanacetum cinerariifolium TaxID=118510 RepID=A0A6L2JFZ6_TANCI|nr:hypothetical protein [Tanacetum cinerariifolium]
MSTTTFAKTHNLIAFLEKPSKSDGFEQIVDFLNANQIKYALTVSLIIYIACIKQFWITLKIKTINDNVRLQALIDGKKVVITEASIRHDLKLNDVEGEEITDIDADVEVNLENVYNLDMAYDETVLSMQDVTDADGKEVAEELVEVITTTKIIVDEVCTAGGELNATNEEPVSLAHTNISTAQPKIARRIEAEWNADIKDNIDWNEVIKQVQSRQSDADNTKEQDLEEQKEAEELKRNLEIAPDDEDGVFVNVAPLSS